MENLNNNLHSIMTTDAKAVIDIPIISVTPPTPTAAAIVPAEIPKPPKESVVETDSNNYLLTGVINNHEGKYKTVGLIYDEITLKKFFVFVCDCSLMFKRSTRELDNFTRTVCYEDLKDAMIAFNKVVDWVDAHEMPNKGMMNDDLLLNAMCWTKPEKEASIATEYPTENIDFKNHAPFLDYYDSEIGKKYFENNK